MPLSDVTQSVIEERLRADNPWWLDGHIPPRYRDLPRRALYPELLETAQQRRPIRALVLLGPRRIGKTVLTQHLIAGLIDEGVTATRIGYASIDAPVYHRLSLEDLLDACAAANDGEAPEFMFFDEIQYLKDWETHLKDLVDRHGEATKFVVTGSAAAALRAKSAESGAGRFTDVLVPPLTFWEYLEFTSRNVEPALSPFRIKADDTLYTERRMSALNTAFFDYINFGSYPEVALQKEARANMGQFVRQDIIEKVLLRDLPSLYGITDIRELNDLFVTLAFNTGAEMALEELSQKSNISKPTIKRYLEYLEAAFLIRVLERVDRNARRFQRAHTFKVYLTSPSLRAALFAPIEPDDEEAGKLVETAILSQWMGSSRWADYRYARWEGGEVDFVVLDRATTKPIHVLEAKWSNRHVKRPEVLKAFVSFCQAHQGSLTGPRTVTTRTRRTDVVVNGQSISLIPAAVIAAMKGIVWSTAGVQDGDPDG